MDFGTYNAIVYNGNSVNDQAGIPAVGSQASSWVVRQITQDQQAASWLIRHQIADSQSATWDVTNTIVQSLQPSWSLRSWAVASIQASWIVRMFSTRALQSSWLVMVKVAHVLHLFWDKSSPKGPPSLRAGLNSHDVLSGLTKPQKVTAGLAPTRTKPVIIQSDTFATLTDEIN